MDVSSGWFSLLGVGLGSLGAFVGQYLATRQTKAQAADAKVAALRTERKEAIMEFLKICQSVEHVAERRYQEEDRFVEGSPDLTHEMWFRQKCLDLVVGRSASSAAFEYANQLVAATYGRVPDGVDVWEFVSRKRLPFLEAAKKELGIAPSPAAGN